MKTTQLKQLKWLMNRQSLVSINLGSIQIEFNPATPDGEIICAWIQKLLQKRIDSFKNPDWSI